MSKEKLKFTFEDPRHLVKNKWNPNKMSPEEEAKLRNSLQKHGHVRPILVRTLEDGTLEIVGGEHRVEVSIDLGMTEVPVINLGQISDEDAKRALMIDNSRYGHDDAGLLSELLTGLGSADELAEWMNMGVDELGASFFEHMLDSAAALIPDAPREIVRTLSPRQLTAVVEFASARDEMLPDADEAAQASEEGK